MKKLLSIIILGLFFIVLGCEKDEAIQSKVSDVDGVEVVGAEELGQDVVGNLGPVEGVQHRAVNTRAANGEGCDFTLDPDYFEVSLLPGESVTEIKKACVETPDIGDVLFSFDLTGSMTDELAAVKGNCEDIALAISNEITECRAGVVSHLDYPGIYSSCGYNNMRYGGDDEYPYRLEQKLTEDNDLVKAAVNGLSIGWGADYPESYARVFYETYNDDLIDWRPEAKKYVVAFLDAVPHDC
ncbi:MAG: hypothetical protein HKN68_16350, partial [Saprospiraceae bacterium]|nr:hypothetical protein [Saprospiraceae bacterium]